MALATAPLAAQSIRVPALPAPVHADTETSTNIALPQPKDWHRHFTATLVLDATPETNVEVLFGRDDGVADGNLAEDEVAFKLGWRRNKWFIASPRDKVWLEAESTTEPRRKNLVFSAVMEKGGVKSAVLREGGDVLPFAGLAAAPDWLDPGSISMAKVIIRGTGAREASVGVDLKSNGMVFIIR